jgi:hypothetical protein
MLVMMLWIVSGSLGVTAHLSGSNGNEKKLACFYTVRTSLLAFHEDMSCARGCLAKR